MSNKRLCGFKNLAMATLLAVALSFIGSKSHAQMPPATVTVTVIWSNALQKNFTAPWYPNMTALDAMKLAIPNAEGGVSYTLSYYSGTFGYFVNNVRGAIGTDKKWWGTCLTPAGANSQIFSLPLGVDRIIVGPGDVVTLAYNPKPSGAGGQAPLPCTPSN